MSETSDKFEIETLGKSRIPSPLPLFNQPGSGFQFVTDETKVMYYSKFVDRSDPKSLWAFQAAGPREKIYFDPSKVRVGMVTCGGLCPGLNNVIRTIVMQLNYHYGVKYIFGFKYGYQGFIAKYGHDILELTPEFVKDIHYQGGTLLSSSRGPQDIEEIVDCLERRMVSILFCVGGDGTLTGAHRIAQEIKKRGLKIGVVGVPKTIDNDIRYCVKTFGFETAFAKAVESIQAAHVEAYGSPNGITLVKLMGRDSGFIAANTVLACPDVNFVLVPEVPFKLEGEAGLLTHVELLMHQKKKANRHPHAVVVVAEGAGQDLLSSTGTTDASGNVRYGDIGVFLRDKIKTYFKSKEMEINLKYIEPSYMIRSLPANPHDAIFCYYLADHAVHAAMAGKTDLMIGYWNGQFTHVPLKEVIGGRKRIDPNSDFWRQVLACTGQPHGT